MFLKKRFFLVLLILVLLGSMSVWGEGQGQGQGQGQGEGTGAEEVVIDFWHLDVQDEHQPIWQELADRFTALHPHVKIKITVLENEAFKSKIATVLQSGDIPDIFRSWGGGVMNERVEAGLLRDITDEYRTNWDSQLGEGAVGVYSYKDRIYGLPYDMGCVGIWYNKELLTQVGYEKPPETWSAFIECVKKLKAAGIIPIAVGEGDKWPGHFWWVYLAVRLGGKPAFLAATERTGSFKDEPFVKAGQLLKELVELEPFQEGFLAATYDGDQARLMGNGQAAMELMGQWAPGVQAAASESGEGIGDKLGFMLFPEVEGGTGKLTDVMGGGDGLVIGRDAPDEAVEFLKFITNKENQAFLAAGPKGIVPTALGVEPVDDNLKKVAKAIGNAEYFQLYYDQYLPAAVGSVVLDAVQGILAGTISPEQAAAMIDDAYVAETQ